MSGATVDAIRSELVSALASDPRRSRGGRGDSTTKAAARELRTRINDEAARLALDALDAEHEAAYAARVSIPAAARDALTLATGALVDAARVEGWATGRRKDVRRDHDGHALTWAANHWHCATCAGDPAPHIAPLVEAVSAARDTVSAAYAPALDPRELPRFVRTATYRGYGVGMLALDPADIVSEALLLAYLPEHADSLETRRVNGRDVLVPSVGGMYRNLKRAHRDALDRFRVAKRGAVAVYSTDDPETLAALGLTDEAHARHYGWAAVTPDALDALLSVEEVGSRPALAAAEAAADRAALIRATAERMRADGAGERVIARRLGMSVRDLRDAFTPRTEEAERVAAGRLAMAEAERAERVMRERLARAAESSAVDPVNRAALRLIAAGESIADTAAALGTHSDALVSRLRALPFTPTRPVPVSSQEGARGYVRKVLDGREPSTSGPVAVWRLDAKGDRVRVA